MHYSIKGDNFPVLICELTDGESLITQHQSMGWMSDNFKIATNIGTGLINSISKIFTCDTSFLNSYTCLKDIGTIAFPLNFPGKIIAKSLGYDESIICNKSAFIAGSDSLSFELFHKKAAPLNFLNNKNFVLQKITGPGIIFLGFNGYSQEFNLDNNEKLKVNAYNLTMFDTSINFNIETIKGFKNMFLDDEDASLITLTGPGNVHVQSIPTKSLSQELITNLYSNKE